MGTFVLGVLLFLAGWLFLAAAGFRRHPLTGLLTLMPGVNIVALPSLWHKVSGWVITAVVGAVLAVIAWFAGADTHVYERIRGMGVAVHAPQPASTQAETPAAPAEPAVQTVAIPAEARSKPDIPAEEAKPAGAAAPQAAPTPPAPPPEPVKPLPVTKDLPAAALFHVVFQDIAVSKLADSAGQYVRVVQQDGHQREGKVQSASADAIELEERVNKTSTTLTLKLSGIRSAAIMIHKGEE